MQKLITLYRENPEAFIQRLRELVKSNAMLDNLDAILIGGKFRIQDKEYVDGLKQLLTSDNRFLGVPLAFYAIESHISGLKAMINWPSA